MSAAATQLDFNSYSNHSIFEAIVNFINENGEWQGNATELSKKLGLNINPRVLSTELKKVESELENRGILINWKRSHGRNVIALCGCGEGHKVQQNRINYIHPTNLMSEDVSFATPSEKEAISFPFEWKYGEITELSKIEKDEVNKVRHFHGKTYRKSCNLCGVEGDISFRKVSDGNPCLICRECAEKYVESAIKL